MRWADCVGPPLAYGTGRGTVSSDVSSNENCRPTSSATHRTFATFSTKISLTPFRTTAWARRLLRSRPTKCGLLEDVVETINLHLALAVQEESEGAT